MLYKYNTELLNFLNENNIKYFVNENATKIFVNETLTQFKDLQIEEIKTKFKLTSKKFQEKRTIKINNTNTIDFNELLLIAGPCSIKDYKSLDNIASKLKEQGIKYIRAGAYKPRTSPHDFQGLEATGLDYLKQIKEKYDLKIVSEIMSENDVERFDGIVDVYQVGARNMQNFTLLKKLGETNNLILLKRGLNATMEEFVLAAEYIIYHGNPNVILCERGIRSFETKTRNTLDLSVVCFVNQETNLNIIIDPSHGCGIASYVYDLSLASVACGASGLIVEADIDPLTTNTDAFQTIDLNTLQKIQNKIKQIKEII